MLRFVFTPLPSERHRKQPQGLFKLQHLLGGSNKQPKIINLFYQKDLILYNAHVKALTTRMVCPPFQSRLKYLQRWRMIDKILGQFFKCYGEIDICGSQLSTSYCFVDPLVFPLAPLACIVATYQKHLSIYQMVQQVFVQTSQDFDALRFPLAPP